MVVEGKAWFLKLVQILSVCVCVSECTGSQGSLYSGIYCTVSEHQSESATML